VRLLRFNVGVGNVKKHKQTNDGGEETSGVEVLVETIEDRFSGDSGEEDIVASDKDS